jgi:hypothetical protein
MRPRRASPNGTSECSSTRPPKYRASRSLTTSRGSPAGAVQIGRLRPISPAEGNLGNYPWPLALDVERAF